MRWLVHGVVTGFVKTALRILCRVDASALAGLPRSGPYLVVINHVNFLEVPLVYTFLQPRRLYSLVKAETWRNPLLGFLANTWHAIPLQRGVTDFRALNAAGSVFKAGHMLVMAPEGTRSGTGVLKKAHGGAALLAFQHRVPVYPLAHTGGERFRSNLRRLRRTPFTFHLGQPFMVRAIEDQPMTSALRQQLTTEIMGQLATLLPPEQRGVYADQVGRQPSLLEFIHPEQDPVTDHG